MTTTTTAPTRHSATAGADQRSRRPGGQARRDRIVEAAIELFAAKGFRGTSISELAERVDMTHPGILYYFGTKERLLLDVVHEREERERHALVTAMEVGGSATAALDQIARFVVGDTVLTRLYVVLAAENLDPDDPLHDFFVERYDRARRAVEEALRAEQERGAIGQAIDPVQIALEVIATLMGLEMQWLMDPTAFDYLDAVDRYTVDLTRRLTEDHH